MDTFRALEEKREKLAVVGIGYVGMPLAVEFAKKFSVIGYDISKEKVAQYRAGKDATLEVGDAVIADCGVDFTSDACRLKEAKFIVVAVPTPVNGDKTPDLTPVIAASKTVGQNLTRGGVVVYESTVYPGVTEDICIPILEQESGLRCGVDFKVGYSPERINPGDKVHTLRTIRKVVSGIDTETVDEISKIYDTVVDAGTYAVSSIKTAEAVKLVENSQRDINIAFMNEMSMAFERMGIDTNEVVDGMNTKWNALGFRPGLVGGHCIGVDPYYFIYEADQKGYTSKIVSMGRTVNDSMGTHIADATVKRIIQAGGSPTDSNIVILGLTFKENCPDVRNTRVIDIYKRLQEYNINAAVCDPWADPELVKKIYGIELTPLSEIKNADCIIHAVAHNEFKVHGLNQLMSLFRSNSSTNVLIDVKGQWNTRELSEAGISWWRM